MPVQLLFSRGCDMPGTDLARKMNGLAVDRRGFVKSAGGWIGGLLLARPLTRLSGLQKLRTAHIGVGGMGSSDLNAIASHTQVEIAALCDVDSQRLDQAHAKHPGAKTYADFRDMLDALGDAIDAVVVSTPDHTHAPAAMMALQMGKPVYCQKPLTHDVYESRRLREVAEQKQLVTQMGIQIHSSAVYRRAVQIIQQGTIGKVSAVHAWSNKNWGFDGERLPAAQAAPGHLEWDLWLGTAAARDFVPGVYHPASWRKLIDFGTGTLGDMGVHIFDTPYRALELTAPNWVRTSCRQPTGLGHPERNIVHYEFPGTKYTTPQLTWKWYDGGDAPPRHQSVGLPDDVPLPGQGSLFIGEAGQLLLPHIAEPRLFPREKFKNYQPPQVAGGNHYHQWIDACRGEGQASADFGYAGPLTEALLLGVVANRFPGVQLEWNADDLNVTNLSEANRLLKRDYRDDFKTAGL